MASPVCSVSHFGSGFSGFTFQRHKSGGIVSRGGRCGCVGCRSPAQGRAFFGKRLLPESRVLGINFSETVDCGHSAFAIDIVEKRGEADPLPRGKRRF